MPVARLLWPLLLAARALLDLVLPVSCAACGSAGSASCDACRAPLQARPAVAWPDPAPPGLPPPYAVTTYDGPVRALVVAHKEDGVRALRRPLGAALAAAAAAAWVDDLPAGAPGGLGAAGVVLLPMPSRRSAVRVRGRDPTLALARSAADRLRATGLPCAVLPVLRLRSGVRDQAGLGAAARAANLRDAVRLRRSGRRALDRRPPGALVLLVDDIVTTGASLTAAAAVLRAHGVEVRAAAVVAATQRRRAAARATGPLSEVGMRGTASTGAAAGVGAGGRSGW